MFRVCFFVSCIIDKIIGTEEIGWTPTKGTCLTMSQSSYSFLCIEQYIAFTFVLKHLLYLRILLSFLGKEIFNIIQEIRQMNQNIWVFE